MAPRMVVSTMLTTVERGRVGAAGTGLFDVVHRDSIDEVMGDVRAQRAGAVVVSVSCCLPPYAARIEGRIATIVRDFPRVTTLALLSDATEAAPAAMLSLGRSGIRTVVDARRPDGWQQLRLLLAEPASPTSDIVMAAASALTRDLADAGPECRRFFLTLFNERDRLTTVTELGRALAVLPSTLISRFARRALPSPKIYLSWARLVRAAALLENPGVSIASAATTLDYSSPQSFSRHVKLRLGLPVAAFRREYGGRAMLGRFREELVIPHLERLKGFRPIKGIGD